MASRGSRSSRKNKGSGVFTEAGDSLKQQRLTVKEMQAEQVRLAAVQWMADSEQTYAARRELALRLQAKQHEKIGLIREAAQRRKENRRKRYLANVARVTQQKPVTAPRLVVRPNGVRARGNRLGCGASFRAVENSVGVKILQQID